MLNGVLLVSSASGALLFSKAYAENFGFPPNDEGEMDQMSLAAMVHALQLNACALDNGSKPSEGMNMVETDNQRIHFQQKDAVLCAVFCSTKLVQDLGRELCELIAQRFAAVYGHLVVPGKPVAAKKFRKFRSEVQGVLEQLPQKILQRSFELESRSLNMPYTCVLKCGIAGTQATGSTEASLVHALCMDQTPRLRDSCEAFGPVQVLLNSVEGPRAEGAVDLLVGLLEQSRSLIQALGDLGDGLQSMQLNLADLDTQLDTGTRVLLLCKRQICLAIATSKDEADAVSAILRDGVMEQLCEVADFLHPSQ